MEVFFINNNCNMKQDTNFCKIRAVMEKKYGNFA